MYMQVTSGLSALEKLELLREPERKKFENKFSPFKSGTSYNVRILSFGDFEVFYQYGNFQNPQINSFTPEKLPTLNDRGIPVDNLTPFDKAYQYYKAQSEEYTDEMARKANVYKLKTQMAAIFYDLDQEKFILVGFTKNQGLEIAEAIKKNEKKLDKKAFRLSKEGTGTNTKVSLDVLDLEDYDLTEKQIKAFENAPKEVDRSLFEDYLFIKDEAQMLETLKESFDVTLIGYGETAKPNADEIESVEVEDDSVPF